MKDLGLKKFGIKLFSTFLVKILRFWPPKMPISQAGRLKGKFQVTACSPHPNGGRENTNFFLLLPESNYRKSCLPLAKNGKFATASNYNWINVRGPYMKSQGVPFRL